MIRVLLIDDHAIVREGFKRLIASSSAFEVAAEASNGKDALAALKDAPFDIAVLDLNLGSGSSSGFDLLAQIRQRHPEVRCVVLSMYDDPGLVLRAFAQGAHGYFTKAIAPEELLAGLHRVVAGDRALSSDLAPPGAGSAPHLTQRERETLRGLVSNRTPKQIAFDLGISDKTLYRHRANLLEKLGASSSADLAQLCRERGLLIDLDG